MGKPGFAALDLPPGLEILAELALDLRWTWSHQADHIWRRIGANGHRFSGVVPGGRPASDYTPRVIPPLPGASVPLELPLISWHH